MSCERLAPVPMLMVQRMHGDTPALSELVNAGLVSAGVDSVSVPDAQAVADIAAQRKDAAKKAAQRRWSNRPPTLDEVALYIEEKQLPVDPSHFHAYYEAREWRAKGGPVKNWRSVVAAWAKRATEPDTDTSGGWNE